MILAYQDADAECREWDPSTIEVAGRLAREINAQAPSLTIEHIGSTAVPGCAGKGVIDLLVLYPAGEIELARNALDSLGFQRQTGRDPFPEDRPMRVGAIDQDGRLFRIHAHVVCQDSAEAAGLIDFRDRLRSDPGLVADYVAEKRRILAAGLTDSLDYCLEKGKFIEGYRQQDWVEINASGETGRDCAK